MLFKAPLFLAPLAGGAEATASSLPLVAAASDSVVKVSFATNVCRDILVLSKALPSLSSILGVASTGAASVLASPVTIPLIAGAGTVSLILFLASRNNGHSDSGDGGGDDDNNNWILWWIYLQLLSNPANAIASASNVEATKTLLKVLINRAIEHKTISAKVLVKSFMAEVRGENVRAEAIETAGTHLGIEVLSSFFGLVGESTILEMAANSKTPITPEMFKYSAKGLASTTVAGAKAKYKGKIVAAAMLQDMLKYTTNPLLDDKFDEYIIKTALTEDLGETELQTLRSLIADKNFKLDTQNQIEQNIIDSYEQLSLRTIDIVNKYSNAFSKTLTSAVVDAMFAPLDQKNPLEKIRDTAQDQTLVSIVEEILSNSRPLAVGYAS